MAAPVTVLGRSIAFFPAAVGVGSLACAAWAVLEPGVLPLAMLATVLYGVPPALFRVHQWVFPLRPGVNDLAARRYDPWWGAHQLQLIYVAFPALESVLRLVPGLFSLWLRAWGARVGRRVHWSPGLTLLDRTLIDVGDDVVFGYLVTISTHVIAPAGRRLRRVQLPVVIGRGAFVGAGVVLAPGVTIDEGAFVAAGTHLHPRTHLGSRCA